MPGGIAGRALAGAGARRVARAAADAHKPVTSKYTFTEDVYPIVKEQCGSCHAPGGVAPMSLLTYDDARPWAESIRLELTIGAHAAVVRRSGGRAVCATPTSCRRATSTSC